MTHSEDSKYHRIKHCLSYLVLFILSIMLSLSLFSARGWAVSASGSGDCPAVNSGDPASACNSCITSAIYENFASGSEIINAMFTAINGVLSKIEKSFFNGIVGATDFQAMIGTAILLYVIMYGFMIMFNLGTYRVNEVVTRLVKVAFVYMLTSPAAWGSFNTWVNAPIIGGMNQLISGFTQVAATGSGFVINIPYGSGASGYGGLDATAFSAMFGSSMTSVFSVQLATAIISLAQTGFFGWLIAIFLFWGLVEFLLMMIGAVITYAKSIIGLAFLFGIAPLFFIFLLFEKTRPIFMNWVFQVVAFALQPVMLFAFLSFYVALVNEAVPYLLTDTAKNKTNFCWTKWFSVPGALWDMFAWRPTTSGAYHPLGWANNTTGKVLPSPINVANAIYFLMLCHLGRTFSKFIDTLSNDIAGGIGPGTVRGGDVGGWAKKGVGGAVRGIRGKS